MSVLKNEMQQNLSIIIGDLLLLPLKECMKSVSFCHVSQAKSQQKKIVLQVYYVSKYRNIFQQHISKNNITIIFSFLFSKWYTNI